MLARPTLLSLMALIHARNGGQALFGRQTFLSTSTCLLDRRRDSGVLCLPSQRRSVHIIRNTTQEQRSSSKSFKVATGLSIVATLGLALGFQLHANRIECERQHSDTSQDRRPLGHLKWSALVRRYVVYTCCSSTTLIDYSPVITDWCRTTKMPGAQRFFEWFMSRTFFPQFVGGETAEACMDIIQEGSKQSIGAILVYSAEVDDHKIHGASSSSPVADYLYADKVNEFLHSIRIVGQCNELERCGSPPHRDDSALIAIKVSGLLQDASVLERASAAILPRESFSNPPATLPPSDTIAKGASPGLMIPLSALNDADTEALKALWNTLQLFARTAQENGNVRILIDAEYSWYQPAIDALFESCAQKFNRIKPHSRSWLWRKRASPHSERRSLPLIYNTYQAYLRRTPAYLAMSLERARVGNYSLGVKLVRGAYVEKENELWKDTIVSTPPGMDKNATEARRKAAKGEWRSPVWPSKPLTDECYDMCARLLIDRITGDIQSGLPASVGVVFAGHNWYSAMANIAQMVKNGLAAEPGQDYDSPDAKSVEHDLYSPYPFHNLQLRPGVRGRIHLGQLYGMADDLTHAIQCAFDPSSGEDGPHVAIKYIPYGDLSLVMPYLTRRAQENKSVMGDGRAGRERAAIRSEMWTRVKQSIFGTEPA